jgi:hypothetical protein
VTLAKENRPIRWYQFTLDLPIMLVLVVAAYFTGLRNGLHHVDYRIPEDAYEDSFSPKGWVEEVSVPTGSPSGEVPPE